LETLLLCPCLITSGFFNQASPGSPCPSADIKWPPAARVFDISTSRFPSASWPIIAMNFHWFLSA
jgi:hypothetical protein